MKLLALRIALMASVCAPGVWATDGELARTDLVSGESRDASPEAVAPKDLSFKGEVSLTVSEIDTAIAAEKNKPSDQQSVGFIALCEKCKEILTMEEGAGTLSSTDLTIIKAHQEFRDWLYGDQGVSGSADDNQRDVMTKMARWDAYFWQLVVQSGGKVPDLKPLATRSIGKSGKMVPVDRKVAAHRKVLDAIYAEVPSVHLNEGGMPSTPRGKAAKRFGATVSEHRAQSEASAAQLKLAQVKGALKAALDPIRKSAIANINKTFTASNTTEIANSLRKMVNDRVDITPIGKKKLLVILGATTDQSEKDSYSSLTASYVNAPKYKDLPSNGKTRLIMIGEVDSAIDKLSLEDLA